MRKSAGNAVRSIARAALAVRAQDRTAETAERSCLVVSPHADDETLASGATIARKRAASQRVMVVIVSDGSRSHISEAISSNALVDIRRQEAACAAARLGVEEPVQFLSKPDLELMLHVDEIAEELYELIREFRPAEVLAPHRDEPLADHEATSLAVRAAISRSGLDTELLEYPIWMWASWPWSGQTGLGYRVKEPVPAIYRPKVCRISTAGYLDAKKHALQAYETQLTHFRGDPGWDPLPAQFVNRFLSRHELFWIQRP
jgi:LmbE family N-acetylglucosaminyl deacetylase